MTILLVKWFDIGPIWTGKYGFANFFVCKKLLICREIVCCWFFIFAKIFEHKVRKTGVHVINDYVHKRFPQICSPKLRCLSSVFACSNGAQSESFNKVLCLHELHGFWKNIKSQNSKNWCVQSEQLCRHMLVNPFLPVHVRSRSDLLRKKR